MTQTSLKQFSPRTLTLRRLVGLVALVVVIGTAFWAARVTRAEFEVPLVETTDFVPTEFRSIWSYKRSVRWLTGSSNPNATSGPTFENYEAFAIGQPLDSANGTTSIFRFNGTLWEKILPQTNQTMSNGFQLNSVSGQFDNGAGYAPINFIGRQGGSSNRQAYVMTLPNYPSTLNAYNPSAKTIATMLIGNYQVYLMPLVADLMNNVTGAPYENAVPNNSELYAIDEVNTYKGATLAGGMNGWLATRARILEGTCGNIFLSNTVFPCASTVDPDGTGPEVSARASKEQWTLFQLSGANVPVTSPPASADNITGIKFVDLTTAYVTTSTFPTDGTGQPKAPYLRECNASQKGKLFRVTGSARTASNWTLLKEFPGECIYGLTVTTIDAPTLNFGPLQTELWLATSRGVQRVTDNNDTIPATLVLPSPKAAYAITSSLERSGNGQQLLLNGNFQSWARPLIGADRNNPQVDPTGWLAAGEYTEVRTVDGVCGSGNRELRMIERSAGNWALAVEAGLVYDDVNKNRPAYDCDTPINSVRDHVVMGIQRVNLSDIEGSRFKVKGSYKVTYVDSASWPAANKPIVRQGGVTTACTGAYPPNNVDCPYSNKKALRVISSPLDDTTNVVGHVNGYIPFEFEFSRATKQFQTPLLGVTGVPYVSEEGQYLEIRCQGTYGVRVECDDLQVEVVSDPPLPGRSVVTVLAVGQDGLAVLNNDAVGSPSTWSVEDQTLLNLTPGNEISLNTISNAGGSHIFAGGTRTSLFQRSPGNISGFLWLGSAQTGSTGNAGLGWVSANCANLKNAAQRSLCQRQSQSFGLSLENNILSGRGWFGKQLTTAGTNVDDEGRDLGTCLAPARWSGAPAGEPYNVSGSCDLNSASATYLRCKADTSKACVRDFDCYGRCSGDEGVVCLTSEDCAGTTAGAAVSLNGSRLRSAPATNLICGTTGGSPNACTAAGWLTFNANDLPTTPVNQRLAPDGTTLQATYNETNGKLSGWGRFMTLANSGDPNYQATEGWVRIRGDQTNPAGTKVYGAQSCGGVTPQFRCSVDPLNTCANAALIDSCAFSGGFCTNLSVATCKYGFDRSLQSCRPTNLTCTNFCGGNPNQPCMNDAECLSLHNNTTASCEPIGYCSNTLNLASPQVCANDSQCTTAGSFCVVGSVCGVGAAGSCDRYGVDHDQATGKFQGFAWSAEYGWIDFRMVQKGTTRFLQTRLGDVYAGGNISSTTSNCGSGSFNATYLVSSSKLITNFCSALTTGIAGFDARQSNVPLIPISSGENDYSNALGRFDLTGLETTTRTVGVVNYNKYDLVVQSINTSTTSIHDEGSPLTDAAPIVLGQKVYKADCAASGGTCTINQALKFANASAGQNGAGILVVNGNLTIANNISYVNSTVTDLRQLASLVVVVRGDLNIENQVTNLVGAYYVEGTIFTTPDATADSSDNRYPLTIRGLMIAQNFKFNRRFAGTVESPLPSELFIFDGRLQSNPLPGMVDFASALPNGTGSNP